MERCNSTPVTTMTNRRINAPANPEPLTKSVIHVGICAVYRLWRRGMLLTDATAIVLKKINVPGGTLSHNDFYEAARRYLREQLNGTGKGN